MQQAACMTTKWVNYTFRCKLEDHPIKLSCECSAIKINKSLASPSLKLARCTKKLSAIDFSTNNRCEHFQVAHSTQSSVIQRLDSIAIHARALNFSFFSLSLFFMTWHKKVINCKDRESEIELSKAATAAIIWVNIEFKIAACCFFSFKCEKEREREKLLWQWHTQRFNVNLI